MDAKVKTYSELSPADPLKPGERLVSPEGKFYAELDPDVGILVRNAAGKPVWGLRLSDRGPFTDLAIHEPNKWRLSLLKDGKAIWWANTNFNGEESRCSLQDDGALVFTDITERVAWRYTDSALWNPLNEEMLATLRRGETPIRSFTEISPQQPLNHKERLVSPKGKCYAELNPAVGIVVRDAAGAPMWGLKVEGGPIQQLAIHEPNEWKLSLLRPGGAAIWGVGDPFGREESRCRLDDDGKLRLFGFAGEETWSSEQAERWNPLTEAKLKELMDAAPKVEKVAPRDPTVKSLTKNKRLLPGERLLSEDGKFSVELDDRVGLMARDATGKAIWGLGAPPAVYGSFEMVGDGGLRLCTTNGRERWRSPQQMVASDPRLVLDDKGVLRASSFFGQYWASDTEKLVTDLSNNALKALEARIPRDADGKPYEPGSRPGEKLALSPGESLKPGERIVSEDGAFSVELDERVGLMARDAKGTPVWGLGARPSLYGRLELGKDQNLHP